jgi:hypothetical protein
MEHRSRSGTLVRQRAVDRNGSVGIETGYGLEGTGIESRGVRFSTHFQTSSEAHSASYTMSTGSLPGVKRPVRTANHQPPSSSEVKERLQLQSTSPQNLTARYTVYCTVALSNFSMWPKYLPEDPTTYTVKSLRNFRVISKIV